MFWAATYVNVIGIFIPSTIVAFVYGIIVHQTYKSSKRVATLQANGTNSHSSNTKRDIRVVRNILTLVTIFMCGGTPCVILTVWNEIQPIYSPPEALYLLKDTAISLSIAVMLFMLIKMNKQVRDTTIRRLYCRFQRIPTEFAHPQQTLDHRRTCWAS
ncbi:MAG: hypothetical protein IT212_13300 [Bacteroidia bacterium]|nr:hypothetical protein [Bacteroidia bacterium]